MSSLTAPLQLFNADIFTSSSTQQHDLGARGQTADGRKFRYVKAGGTTLVPGKLQQAPAEDTSNFQNLAVAAAAIGATSVTTTSTVTLTANQLTGGLLTVTTSTGAGYSYRIKGHAAATAAVVTFNLEDPILVALTTSSKIDVHPNKYNGVIVNPTTQTSVPVGIPLYAITNAQFGWIQSGGPVGCLADGALTVGLPVVASNGTAGAVEPLTGTTLGNQPIVGTTVTGVATTEYGQIELNLD